MSRPKNDPTLADSIVGPLRLDLLSRALAAGCQVERKSRDTWLCTSTDPVARGEYPITTRDDGTLRCYCTAGQQNPPRPCCHVALVQVVAASGAVPVPADSVTIEHVDYDDWLRKAE